MTTKTYIGFGVVLTIALVFLIVGSVRSHKVLDKDAEDFGFLAYYKISERQLVIDATFSGVARRGTQLISTYDRSEPRGKRACPT